MGMEVGVASELVDWGGEGGGGHKTSREAKRLGCTAKGRRIGSVSFFVCNPSAIMCNRLRRHCARVSAD